MKVRIQWKILPMMLLSISACNKGGIDPIIEDVWQIKETSYHNVDEANPTIVHDENTDSYFYFPNGGIGSLTVGEVISGPDGPFEGKMLYIDYEGDDIIELLVPVENNEELPYVSGYGFDNGSYNDEIGYAARWHGIVPVDSLHGSIAFLLVLPYDDFLKSSIKNNKKGFNHFMVTKLNPSGTDAKNIDKLQDQVNEYLIYLTSLLSPVLQTEVRSKWSDSHAPVYYLNGNYYKGFIYYTDWVPIVCPQFSVVKDADNANIAHETGHYFHHLLAGDDVFKAIFSTVPGSHALGEIHEGRKTIAEDYAYFIEFLLTNSVKGSNLYHLQGELGAINLRPDKVDYPSIEGFGAALLASLIRKDTKTNDVYNPIYKLEVPVIGANEGDVLSLFYMGAKDINELRNDVETYLTGIGEEDKFPVILQRLGWQYIGTVKIVDKNGNPIKNADVSIVSKTKTKEYIEKGFMSDDDGVVTFSRCFGGQNYLRVFLDGDPIDCPIKIDWSNKTNLAIDLDPIEVVKQELDISGTTSVVLWFSFPEFYSDYNLGNNYFLNDINCISISQNTIVYYQTLETGTIKRRIDCTIEIDPKAKTIKHLSYYHQDYRVNLWGDVTANEIRKIECENIPLDELDTSGHLVFKVTGEKTCDHIIDAQAISLNSSFTSFQCDDESYLGIVLKQWEPF